MILIDDIHDERSRARVLYAQSIGETLERQRQ